MTLVKPDGDDLKRAIKMAVAASIAWAIAARLTEQAPVFAAIVPLVAIRKQDPYSAINVSAGRILGVFVDGDYVQQTLEAGHLVVEQSQGRIEQGRRAVAAPKRVVADPIMEIGPIVA